MPLFIIQFSLHFHLIHCTQETTKCAARPGCTKSLCKHKGLQGQNLQAGSIEWFFQLQFLWVITTTLLTPRSRVLLEKLTVSRLVKKFAAFYGTRSFITAFTSARHLFLSWASLIQSIPPNPTSWRSNFILSSHLCLGLPSGLCPSGFPTKTLYTPLPSPLRAACPAHLILLDYYDSLQYLFFK